MAKKAAKRGRPSSYTDALGEKIARRIAEGDSVRKISESPGMPSRFTILKWGLDPNHPFSVHYARARVARAEFYADQIEDIAKRLLDNDPDLDPQAARVAIDAIKWTACKMRPDVYGDRLKVDHEHSVSELPDADILGIIGVIRGQIGRHESGDSERALPQRAQS